MAVIHPLDVGGVGDGRAEVVNGMANEVLPHVIRFGFELELHDILTVRRIKEEGVRTEHRGWGLLLASPQ